MNETYNTLIYRLFNSKLVESQKKLDLSMQLNQMKTWDHLMYIMEVQFLALLL